MKFCLRAALVGALWLFLPGLLEQFEAPKAAVVRIFGVAALAAAIFVWRSRARPRWTALDVIVLSWLAVELLATLASVSPRISFFGDTKQSDGLLTSLGLAGLYAAASGASPREARRTLGFALVAAGVTGAYAAFQALGLDPTRWAHIATYERAGPFMRPFGTLGQPNVLGVITAAATASAVALAIGERSRRWPWAALAALMLAVTVVTLSRGAWLGAAAGVLVASWLGPRDRDVAPARAAGWFFGIGLALALGLVISGFGPTILRRLSEIAHPESGSARSRLEIWRIAWRAWQARPWLGVGPDAFELTFQRFQTPEYWRYEWATVPAHAHSIVLNALATRGVAGLAACLALAGAWILAARRAWTHAAERRPAVVAWIAGSAAIVLAGLFGALGISGAAWLAAAAGSLVAMGKTEEMPVREGVPAAARRKRARAPAPRRPLAPIAAGAVAGLVMVVLAVLQLLAFRSSFEALDWAPRAPGDGDPARALRAADRAPRLAPWDDQPEYYRAQTLLRMASAAGSTQPLDSAERSARRAISLEPQRAIDYQALGSVLLARARAGDLAALDGARVAFAQASALAPYNALLWLQLADAEIALGQPAEALPRIRHALALYPDVEVARRMLERASASAPARAPSSPPG